MNYNTEIWEKSKQPPPFALKEIQGGRLRGKTDINPQWRYRILTELFGPSGIGWKYEIIHVWPERVEIAGNTQVFAFARCNLYIRITDAEQPVWSEPIPGVGGSMLVAKEGSGLYYNDEAYKMAVTDALSVCCKMLGIGADIYAGLWDGTKYQQVESNGPVYITKEQLDFIHKRVLELGVDEPKFLAYLQVSNYDKILASDFRKVCEALNAKGRQKENKANENNRLQTGVR